MRKIMIRGAATTIAVALLVAGCHKKGEDLGTGDAARRSLGVDSAGGGVVDSSKGQVLPAVAAVLSSGSALAVVDTLYAQMQTEDSLALTRAASPRVHAFAEQATTAEALGRRGLRDVASGQSITFVLGPNDQVKDNADAVRSLRQERGAEFDKAYVDHALDLRQDLLGTVNKALEKHDREKPVRDFLAQVQRTLTAARDSLQAIKSSL